MRTNDALAHEYLRASSMIHKELFTIGCIRYGKSRWNNFSVILGVGASEPRKTLDTVRNSKSST